MDVCCGFVPRPFAQLSMPTFTLYADGTAIYRPSTGGTIDAPPPLMQAQLSPEQVDVLIGYALGPGGLAAADAVYDDRLRDRPDRRPRSSSTPTASPGRSRRTPWASRPWSPVRTTPSWPAWPRSRTRSATSTRRSRPVMSSRRRSTSRPSTSPSSRPTPRTARAPRPSGPSRTSSWSCPLTAPPSS